MQGYLIDRARGSYQLDAGMIWMPLHRIGRGRDSRQLDAGTIWMRLHMVGGGRGLAAHLDACVQPCRTDQEHLLIYY